MVDNCFFNGGGSATGDNDIGVAIYSLRSYGVVNNNTFITAAREVIQVWGTEATAWGESKSLGDSNALYVEGNTFSGTSDEVIMGFGGSNYVFRYNTISGGYTQIDSHGSCDGDPRGGRTFEIYRNSITITAASWAGLSLRGGTGVVWENVLTESGGTFSRQIGLTEYQLGYASCVCDTEYPIADQIGRGQDQSLDPLYIWSNTTNGSPSTISLYSAGTACGEVSLSDYIQENRDYYLSVKTGYSPYICPHPLTGLTGGCSVTTAGRSGYNIRVLSAGQGTTNTASQGTVNIWPGGSN
jgi:hypothetical protein